MIKLNSVNMFSAMVKAMVKAIFQTYFKTCLRPAINNHKHACTYL